MRILNFGSCNIDNVYSLEHITKTGETNHAESLTLYPGGKGLNQSVAMAKSGAEIFHAGAIGRDGLFLSEFMASFGVNVEKMLICDEQPTGHAIIQVDSAANNSIIVLGGANFALTREYIDSVLSDFSAGDVITLQNEINDVDYIVEKAYERKMVVFYNPSPFNEAAKRVDLKKVTYLFVNEVEAKALFDFKSVNDFAAKISAEYPMLKVLLTLGKRGSAYIGDGKVVVCPSYKVDAVDTTAAGDTFTGYYISCYQKGFGVAECLKYANAAAALAVSKKGAAVSIPTFDEVKASLKSLKKNDCETEEPAEKIREYLANNLQNANLSDLASALGYSKNYVGKAVRSATGKGFGELLAQIRLEAAEELLVSTDLPIGEIIAKVGYTNEGSFRSGFYARYGEKPLEYRKKRK